MDNYLARYLKEKNMTRAEFARKLRVSKSLITYYLNGKRRPGRRTALRISELTGIPILDILYPPAKKK